MSLIALVHVVPLKSTGLFAEVKLQCWQTSSGKPPWSGLSCYCPRLPTPPFYWGLVLPQRNLQKGTCAHTLAALLQNPQVQLKPFKMHRFLLSWWRVPQVCVCWFSMESCNLQQLGGADRWEKGLLRVTARFTRAQVSAPLPSWYLQGQPIYRLKFQVKSWPQRGEQSFSQAYQWNWGLTCSV